MKQRKWNTFWTSPKRRRDTFAREQGYTNMCLFIPAVCDREFYYVDIVWLGAVQLQYNPSGWLSG